MLDVCLLILAAGDSFPWQTLLSVLSIFVGAGGALGALFTYRQTVRVKELDVQAEAVRLHDAEKTRAAEMAASELGRLWEVWKAQEQEIGGLKQEMIDLRKHRHDLAGEANQLKLENVLLKKEVELLQDQVRELQQRLDQALLELAVERERGDKRDAPPPASETPHP